MKLSSGLLLASVGLSDAAWDSWKLPSDWQFCAAGNIIPSSRRFPFDDSGRIVGGGPVDRGTWPFIVRLKFGRNYLCAGSLIDGKTVVTAAHCCSGFAARDFEVYLNDHYYHQLDPGETRVGVDKLDQHKAFSWNTFKNDICILTLKKDVTQIIGGEQNFPCLPPRDYRWAPGTECYAAGWGLNKEHGSIASELNSVNINTIDDDVCVKLQDHSPTEMLCAGVIGGGRDGCQGDSGGPLLCELEGNVVLAGVTSWGIGCARANHPGEWARVSHYIDWIQPKMHTSLTNWSPSGNMSPLTTSSTTTSTTTTTTTTTKKPTTTKTTTMAAVVPGLSVTEKKRIRQYCSNPDPSRALSDWTDLNLTLKGKDKLDPTLKKLTQCYIRTKEKRLKNPKVEDKEREAFLLDGFGTRSICLRARRRSWHKKLPCWERCLDFFESIKVRSPSYPFTRVDRKKILYWGKQCIKAINKAQ